MDPKANSSLCYRSQNFPSAVVKYHSLHEHTWCFEDINKGQKQIKQWHLLIKGARRFTKLRRAVENEQEVSHQNIRWIINTSVFCQVKSCRLVELNGTWSDCYCFINDLYRLWNLTNTFFPSQNILWHHEGLWQPAITHVSSCHECHAPRESNPDGQSHLSCGIVSVETVRKTINKQKGW